MKVEVEIEIDEKEINEKAKQRVVEDLAKSILKQVGMTSDKYYYRKVIKECVREVIKQDIDNLADRAVEAASVSIANKGLKKVSTEELLSRISDKNE